MIMDNQHTRSSGQAIFLAFLGGAVAGAVAGVLFAPKSGEETRRELRAYARKTEEELIEKAKEARAALDQAIERGKSFVAEKRADVEAAFEAGKEAMKEKMEKCCT
jgi:gas vesicle protein